MMRLTVIVQTREEAVLRVEGWVAGPDVNLLETEGTCLLQQTRRLVLDLHGMRFIDRAGLALFQRWLGSRLVLRGASAFVQVLLRQHGLGGVGPGPVSAP